MFGKALGFQGHQWLYGPLLCASTGEAGQHCLLHATFLDMLDLSEACVGCSGADLRSGSSCPERERWPRQPVLPKRILNVSCFCGGRSRSGIGSRHRRVAGSWPCWAAYLNQVARDFMRTCLVQRSHCFNPALGAHAAVLGPGHNSKNKMH